MSAQPKKYFISTVSMGCINSLAENERHRNSFDGEQMVQAVSPKEADIILVNTCAVVIESEDDSIRMIESYKKLYPDKEIQVSGCLPKINSKRLKSIHQGKVISFEETKPFNEVVDTVEPSDISVIPTFQLFIIKMRSIILKVEDRFKIRVPLLKNIFEGSIMNPSFKHITVSQGCLGLCTFCSIKKAKGKLVSRSLSSIMRQFDSLLERKQNKIWLLADDVGCWGEDIGLNIGDLLESFLATKEDFSLVINFLDPTFLVKNKDSLIKSFSDRRIISVCIPLQSGSQKILDRMKRYYDPDEVTKILKEIKKNNPEICLRTNYIAGFPGESWADLWMSIKSFAYYDAIYNLKFSARPNTLAATYEDQLPSFNKALRTNIMNFFAFGRHVYVFIKSFGSVKVI
jgi:threonylcarbamoyladenosine tRNA methylthiotransferase CDKAL1